MLVFIFYTALFAWLIPRISFFKKSALPASWLIVLFILKIAAGILYGKFYAQPQYYAGSDTWRYFNASLKETDWLLREPVAFIKDIFSSGYTGQSNLFTGKNSYWNDLKSNIIIKLMALMNMVTLRHYYANVVLFNFLFFFGPVALYRIAVHKFRGNKFFLIAATFCIPSFLFWCSGAHKDGLLFSAITLIIFYTDNFFRIKKINITHLFLSIVLLLLIFALRNFMALLLLPAMVAWWLAERTGLKKRAIVVLVYGTLCCLFFAGPFIHKALNFPQYIIDKQNEFKALSGGSQIAVKNLQPTVWSFMQFLPAAIDIGFLRPHIAEIKNTSYVPAVVENIVLWAFFLFGIVQYFIKRRKQRNIFFDENFVLFCFCFCFSVLLLAGYTITFSGAMVRYRSLELPLLFIPVIMLVFNSSGNNGITNKIRNNA